MVNTKVNTRLTRILELLVEKKTQSQIARELNISKVAVHKHIKRMIENGLITESPESTKNLKFYHVNQILTMSEKGLTRGRYQLLFDPHNYGMKFKLVPNGEGSFPKDRKVHKRHWNAFYLDHNLVEFELTTKHLIGYIKNRIRFNLENSKDIDKVLAMIHSIIVQEAKEVVEKYGMKVDLNHPEVNREELKIIDPKIKPSKIRFHEPEGKYKMVYDTDTIEFRDQIDAKNFVDNRIVENKADEILNILGSLARDMTMMFNATLKSTGYLKDIRDSIIANTLSRPNRSSQTPKSLKKTSLQSGIWRFLKP
jgi:biotin operon repressor/ribosomal protein S13